MNEILENTAITLADGNQYYVVKKITYNGELYLYCLNINKAKFALIKVKGGKAYFVKDDNTASAVLKTLLQDPEFTAQVDEAIKQLKNKPKK